VSVLVLFVLPWRAIGWRPAQLPPTWIESVFVATRLVITYLLVHIGWTTMLIAAARSVVSGRRRPWPDHELA
jgi:hypothetical protein